MRYCCKKKIEMLPKREHAEMVHLKENKNHYLHFSFIQCQKTRAMKIELSDFPTIYFNIDP